MGDPEWPFIGERDKPIECCQKMKQHVTEIPMGQWHPCGWILRTTRISVHKEKLTATFYQNSKATLVNAKLIPTWTQPSIVLVYYTNQSCLLAPISWNIHIQIRRIYKCSFAFLSELSHFTILYSVRPWPHKIIRA